ncbi:hypothetical protein M406DRAFT_224021, partial [Cryphonectria parasitica EP155]
LLQSILSNGFDMHPCSYCDSRGLQSCIVSPYDSFRCSECVSQNCAKCDVLELMNAAELLLTSTQHRKLEDEIEELELKLLRLHQQKKMWHERMSRAIRRDLKNLEELEKEEAEEAEAERVRVAAEVQAVVAEES